MTEVIILVPGLFGFADIAGVDFFASVKDALAKSTGISEIHSLDTPPTASLWRRVDALHRAVREQMAAGASRVHLVGHSTGGLDVRLLTTPRYLWPGGPSGADRISFFKRVGAAVSISAPHKGTPLARRLRGANESAVPVLFLLGILAKRNSVEGGPLRLGDWARLALSRAGAGSAVPPVDHPWVSKEGARELARYIERTAEDLSLLHELTPRAMGRLNRGLESEAPGRADEPLSLASFVTVSPPPALSLESLVRLGAIAPARRALYAATYLQARFAPNEFGFLPEGSWVGGDAPERLHDFAATAQDGVVPAASQTMDGRARGLVYADHLEVVGNYRGARRGGEALFDSGARFDHARMEALWSAVAQVIREVRSVEKAA